MERKPEKRGLGRGLSALMSDVPATDDTAGEAPPRPDRQLPIDVLVPNIHQPRRNFSEEALNELAASIREKGIIQPLIVRPAKQEGLFEIVAGERRWRAAQSAQLHELPVIVREMTDSEVLEIAIIENIQRADLNALEEAEGYRQLMDRFGHTQERIADALGKSRSHVANLLRLLGLPDEVQAHLREGRLSAGHARALITAEDPAMLAREVIDKGLTVRKAEELARAGAAPRKRKTPDNAPAEKDADTKALEGDISAALGMTVRIDHRSGGEGGQVSIGYDTLDQLDEICRRLGVSSSDESI